MSDIREDDQDEFQDASQGDGLPEEIEYLENSTAKRKSRFDRAELEQLKQKFKTGYKDWSVNLVALAVLFSGLASTIQPLTTRLAAHPKLFSILVPYPYYHFNKSLNTAIGAFLIYLSLNLYKRKRIAWLLSVVLVAVTIALHMASAGGEYINWLGRNELSSGVSIAPVLVPIVALVLLIALRKRFTVGSDRPRLEDSVTGILVSIFTVLAYGALGFWLLDKRDLGINFELDQAFLRTFRELLLIGNSDLHPNTRFGRWFLDSLHVVGAVAAVYAAYGVFRPIRYKLDTEPRERGMAKAMVELHGRDALDYYKMMPDKSYFFDGDKGLIAYTTEFNIAIGLGDPAAEDADIEQLVSKFRSFCHGNDWKIAFLQTSPKFLDTYKKLGLSVLKVGEDAIVNLDLFSSKTMKGKTFKSKANKFAKEGYELERHTPPHSVNLLTEVQEISDQWLSLPGRKERGFSLGWFDRELIKEDTLFVLRDPEKRGLAFVNQVASFADGQVSIDMMRHREDVPNGTMDFLFAKLLDELHSEGFKTFNLGLAALSGVGEEASASLEEKAVHEIYEHMNRFFSYKGLRRYKEKFKPDWEERFLIYEGGTPGLIKTALAIARAGKLSDIE